MDTKLKNRRNVRIGIIIIGLLLAVGVNVSLFPWMIRNAEQKSAQLFSSSENVNTEYIDTLYQGAYVLYTEIKNEPSENRTEPFVGEGSGYDDYDYISEWSSSFEGVRSETDYYATDGAKKEVNTNAPLYEVLEPDFRIDDDKEQWNSYESVFVLDFDEDGNLSVDVKKDGTVSADTLIKSLLQADRYNEIRTYAVDNDTTFVPVKNFQVVYGIPKDSTNLPAERMKEDCGAELIRKFYLFDTPDMEAENAAERYLAELTAGDTSVLMYESKASIRSEFEQFQKMFFLLGGVLCAIIGLVGVLNFFNAIMTGILARKREFAVLQSVGMTNRQFKQMLVQEGLFYTAGSVVVAFLLSLVCGPLSGDMMEKMFWFCTYHFTILPVIAMLPVFAVLGCLIPAVLYQAGSRQSIVERLREAE